MALAGIEKIGTTWKLPAVLQHKALSGSWNALFIDAPRSGKWVMDASALVDIDSSCLAFFLESLRYAKAHKLKLRFEAWHPKIIALLDAYGVLALFEGYYGTG